MPSIAIKNIAVATLFAFGGTAAAAVSDKPPRFLTVPVLGLRLPLKGINAEPFPENIRMRCGQIENEFDTSRLWILGRAKDATRTYYVLTGYSKRLQKEPGQKLYEYWDNGQVFTVTDSECGGDDAEETFAVHDLRADKTGNVPIPIHKVLADDFAARTVRAFGGPDELRAQIRAQRIDFNRLPSDLQKAFKPYFEPAK
jgi:hypothetical protein